MEKSFILNQRSSQHRFGPEFWCENQAKESPQASFHVQAWHPTDISNSTLKLVRRIEISMKDEKKIGRYIIQGLLGEGAMGSVFRGYDPNLERSVAIKTMRTGNITDPDDYREFKERFFLESRVYARLNHPHIVNVFDCGIDEKEPFLVMEYVEGKPLQNHVRDQGEIRYQHSIDILRHIASGLDYAHGQGVIHRDIKPGNILVDAQNRPKILDFGLAKLGDSNLTQTGLFLGTPNYSSPEQIISGRVDHRSDLYSFSTLAYEMITNRLPFEASSLHAILYQIANEPPKIALEPFEELIDVKGLAKVFHQAFDKNPASRFQSAAAFVDALAPLLEPLKNVRCLVGTPESGTQDREKPNRPPPIPAKMRANTKPEMAAISLKQSPASDVTTQRRALIESARKQFQAAFRTRNISSIRYCLAELKNLGADSVVEEKAVAELEAVLDAQQAANREKLRQKHVEKAREEFRLALEAQNLSSSRYCLLELKKLGVDTQKEAESLEKLEGEMKRKDAERIAQKQAEERRKRTVAKLKAEFQSALSLKDIPFCEKLLHNLKDEGSKVTAEASALTKLKNQLAQEEEQRREWVRKTRQGFQRALAMKDTSACKRILLELQNLLKVDVGAEAAALSHLEADLRREEAAALSQQLVDQAQAGFELAFQQKDLKNCRRIFREFMGLGVQTPARSKELSQMKAQLESLEAEQLKQNMVLHMREKFRDALKRKSVEGCRYYTQELQQLGVKTEEEDKAFKRMRRELEGDSDSFSTGKTVTRAVAGFQEAFGRGDLERCNQYLSELEHFGVDVSGERKSLQILILKNGTSDKLRQDIVRRARTEFQDGLRLRQLDHCRYQLKILSECNAAIETERRQFEMLELEMRQADKPGRALMNEEKLKLRMIEQFRFEFMRSYQSGQIDNCHYYLHELEQLGARVESEREAIKIFDT